MKRVHCFISGNVQGVSFRATTRQKSLQHSVNGWVRNLPDGRVEAVFEGDDESVEALVDFCHEGPAAARVEDIEIREETPEGLEVFAIRR